MHFLDSVEERRLQKFFVEVEAINTSIVRSNGFVQVVDLSMMVLIYIVCLYYPMVLYSSTILCPRYDELLLLFNDLIPAGR